MTKRSLSGLRMLGAFALVALAACGSDSAASKVELVPCPSCAAPVSFLPLEAPPVANLTLTEVAAFQILKAPLMKDGAAVPRDEASVPIVSGRTTLLRLYVRPEGGWSQKQVVPVVRLANETPTGTVARTVTGAPVMVNGPSDEGDLATTVNVEIPEGVLAPDTSFSVTLTDPASKGASPASSPARWPADGSLAAMGNSDKVAVLRVVLVAVAYGADGSNRMPDMSDQQIERYTQQLYKLYPAARVEFSIRPEAFPWPMAVTPGGQGLGALLNAIGQLRAQDQPAADVYYYGAVSPADSFGQFCGGGCVTGLSPIGMPFSVGVGFAGNGSASTMAHEIGHAHTLQHAPCGGAGGPDPMFPYADGGIGSWGYDGIQKILIDPGGPAPRPKPKDLMGYCNPDWISDFHLAKLWNRVRSDNALVEDWSSGEAQDTVVVGEDGALALGAQVRGRWIAGGEGREIVLERASGATRSTGRFFPYDHLPGGVLVLPKLDASVLRVRVPSLGPRASMTMAPAKLLP